MEKDFTTEIIKLLHRNKAFPNYQAERRIDIFINIFLEDLLSAYLQKQITYVCPEFVLKHETGNRSTKVDYLCLSSDEIIFVELKTDNKSFNISQLNLYLKGKPWGQRIIDFESIQKVSRDKKYTVLGQALDQNGLKHQDSFSKPIRVIYIAPALRKPDYSRLEANYEVSSVLPISKVGESINSYLNEWKIVSEFLQTFDLNIFEIKPKQTWTTKP